MHFTAVPNKYQGKSVLVDLREIINILTSSVGFVQGAMITRCPQEIYIFTYLLDDN